MNTNSNPQADSLKEHRSSNLRDEQGRLANLVRSRKVKRARELASRLHLAPDGSRVFLRFTRAQRWEHQLLIVTFTVLAISGLLQRYSSQPIAAFTINQILGGIEALRSYHRLTAFIFVLESIYHVAVIINTWFVRRQLGSMFPMPRDMAHFFQIILYNLKFRRNRPESDRFTVEEKIEYWALLWGSAVMIITGLFQWLPSLTTRFLPGQSIPIARSIHGWEAILATLSILTWHFYHTMINMIKEKNTSIFTGYMSEHEMVDAHPLEYQRIMNASEYLTRNGLAQPIQKVMGPAHGQQPGHIAESDSQPALAVIGLSSQSAAPDQGSAGNGDSPARQASDNV